MAHPKDIKTFRQNFEKAVADYVAAFLKQWDLDGRYGYWVSDDCTGIYAYGDNYFISLADLIYIVDNGVKEKDFSEWQDYCVFAHEYQQTIPNLQSWVKSCPRLSNGQIEHLRGLKKQFDDAIKSANGNF